MNVKRIVIVFVAACLFIFSQPFYVFADRCDDVMAEAGQTFDAAMAASNQKEYAQAIKLFEEAEGYYKQASEMENCRCSKIENSAKKSISACRKNAAVNRKSLEKKEKYEAEVKVVEIYNRARTKFNEGNSYASSQQWENAISAFEEAEGIWQSIASTETENGRKAMELAEKSREMADLARQRLKR